MPDENPILKYWRSELEVFNKNLLSLQQQINEEATHDLRVAIKKLRSCFKIYSTLIEKKHKKELPAGFDSLFSILGKQRDIEMNKKLLLSLGGKNTALLNPILVYLQLLQDQAVEYGRPSIQQFESGKLETLTNQMGAGLENLTNEELLSRANEIVNSSVEKVEDDLKHFKERSHLIRKQLKDVFYQSKMFHGKGLFTKSQLKTLDTILDHLGNVHDHEVLISNLKNFRKTILPNTMKEYAMIKRIEERVEKKKDNLLERAYQSTEKLIARYKKDDDPKKQASKRLKPSLKEQ
jgi:CHAD domain-containing protein